MPPADVALLEQPACDPGDHPRVRSVGPASVDDRVWVVKSCIRVLTVTVRPDSLRLLQAFGNAVGHPVGDRGEQ